MMSCVIDVCSLLESQTFVLAGRLDARSKHLKGLIVELGGETIDVLSRASFTQLLESENGLGDDNYKAILSAEIAFVVAVPIAFTARKYIQVSIKLWDSATNITVRRLVVSDKHEARADFLVKISAIDPNTAISLIEHTAELLGTSKPHRVFREWLLSTHSNLVGQLPSFVEFQGVGICLRCESVLSVADEEVFLKGWFNFQEGSMPRVFCHRGFARVEIELELVRHQRLDITEYLSTLGIAASDDRHGFAFYISLPWLHSPYVLSVNVSGIGQYRLRLPAGVVIPTMQLIHSILTSFQSNHRFLRSLLDRQIGPAVKKSWAQRKLVTNPVTYQRYGRVQVDPIVSIIVPIYGRHDFAEYQLCLFADDPDFQSLELIYFVDDPVIYDDFRLRCFDLFETYRVAFTLAFAGGNFGFAGANNLAVTIARGQHLLFVNSDVFPKTPGWVSRMISLYTRLVKPGLLGVKLLYEDGSVQHAGIVFKSHAPWGDLWINEHAHKGHSSEGLNGVHKANAVTAACALISADLYRKLGGFSEDYIIGDFEDSDLCLKALADGRQNWLSLDIELYHLERQSQRRIGDAQWRENLTLYNCWQHTQRWGELIAKQLT